MTDELNTNAGAGPVERVVRPGAEARWYCLSRDGMATLCTDEEDAKEVAAESWVAWPNNGPYRVAQMVDADQVVAAVAAERERCANLCEAAADLLEALRAITDDRGTWNLMPMQLRDLAGAALAKATGCAA